MHVPISHLALRPTLTPFMRKLTNLGQQEDDLMEISSRASSHTDSEEDEAPEAQESEVDFEGDNLQSAQDKIMSELTRLQDDEWASPLDPTYV